MEIKPEEALANLDRAVSTINTTRDVHIGLINNINALRQVINEWKELTTEVKKVVEK